MGGFSGGAGFENESGVAAVFAHPVSVEGLEVIGGGICVGASGGEDGRAVGKYGFEVGNVIFCDLGEFWIAFEVGVGISGESFWGRKLRLCTRGGTVCPSRLKSALLGKGITQPPGKLS